MTVKAGSGGANEPGAAVRQTRPLAGYVIALAALSALFGLAVLKGRVKDKR
ncbi:MAG: hypothetical protein LC746_13020 [Acidobacteria bacterium]|nr:hypothetical protein [Acidobacteriota bacterium]